MDVVKKKSFYAYVITMSLISTPMLQRLCNTSKEDFAHHVRHAISWNDLGIRLGCKINDDGKITNSNIIPHMKAKVINMRLNTDHFHGQNQGLDDDDFIKFVKESNCLYQVMQKCISSGDIRRPYDYYNLRINELCIDTSHWKQASNPSRLTMGDETLKMKVQNSTSWSDLYHKCGCHPGKICRKTDVSERIKILGLDTNHFCSRGRKMKSEEKIFVVDSHPTDSNLIKKRLVRDHNRLYECSKCKNVNYTTRDGVLMWNDQEITLQLEHINGVHNDNRLDNLTFLCPNCHSQTSTFCGRNRKKIKLTQEWVEDGKTEHPPGSIASLLN